MFEGDQLTQPHGGNVQVLHEQHAPNRDVEQPNNAQIENEHPNIVDDNVVENEQPNIVNDNADLQVISPHDLDMELEEEQNSSQQARTVPKWLINTLMDSKLKFPLQGKTRSTSQQAELHYVHNTLIIKMCN